MMELLGTPYPPPARGNRLAETALFDGAHDGRGLPGVVERLISGDSLTVRGGGQRLHVRLLGIDAPERHYLGQSQQPWAELALRRLQALAPPGATVRLITDQQMFDQYGRLLAYVYRGQRCLNLELVRSGWAVTYPISPNLALLDPLGQAMAEAQAAGRGIFDRRRPLPLLPYEFRHALDHQPLLKLCGDRRTRRYVPPAEYQRTPAARRVFFRTEAEARACGYQPAEPGSFTFAEAADERTAAFTPAMMARLKLRAWKEGAQQRSL
jgi:endonuclease YncB( thermonuclease family)